ncbi:MAG: 50S ribosomal protein L18 [Candidatus Levybacteria bacterium]|nr:50S ribosomal protein L18 [Candidatus Levybacteria bacterium]
MINTVRKYKKKLRTRSKIKGSQRPRLSIFRSNRFAYAQIIDAEGKSTIVSATEKELGKVEIKGKVEKAKALGLLLAKKALAKKIKEVVFDRGNYAYHGRVSAIAAGAREGGLKF